MNPIIDIFATARPADAPIPGAVPLSGEPISAGLFAQAIAEAIGSMAGQIAVPEATPFLFAQPTIAPGESRIDLAEQPLSTIVSQLAAVTITKVDAGAKATTPAPLVVSDPILTLLNSEVVDIAPVQNTAPLAADARPLIAQAANGTRTENVILSLPSATPELAAPTQAVLQTVVESALTSASDQVSKPAMIQAQVDISDEAATAIAFKPAVATMNTKPEIDVTSRTDRDFSSRPVATLKNQLRREFPNVRIESASGKANIEVRLNDKSATAAVPQDNSVTSGTTAKVVDLPIVTTNQMARTVTQVAGWKPAPKSTRSSAVATKPDSASLTKPASDSAHEMPQQAVGGMRKSVLQALKSQGFNFDKFMSKSDDSGAPVLTGVTEKSAGTIAPEKTAMPAVDHGAELNGIERFKLDIKRGHIEALLKKGEIKLQLQPDHLGSLKIKLITSPTETTARLETSSEDARRTVEASLPALRESFERAGLKLNSVEVVVGNESDSRRQQAFQQEANARNAANKRPTPSGSAALPLITEIENPTHAAYGGALNLVA